MSTIKTAVSLDRSLFERLETLAEEMGLSRSRVFSRALEEFLRREDSRRLLAKLDEAHRDEPTPAEHELARRRRAVHRRLVDGEW